MVHGVVGKQSAGIKKRGGPRPGSGRPKGVPNKATTNAREAIAAFVDGNTARLEELLGLIRVADGPAAEWRCIMDLLEYHVPKLARTEIAAGSGSGRLLVMWDDGSAPALPAGETVDAVSVRQVEPAERR